MEKNKMFFIFFLLVIGPVILAQDTTTSEPDTIAFFSYSPVKEFWVQMEDIFDDPNFNNATWGVEIQSLATGEYFYKKNEYKLLAPASNLKLFTTSAGLILLGPDYRFSTNIFRRGEIDGSILVGDLIIQGRGDPTISGRFYNNNMFKVYEMWADSLLASGIDEITGNIVGDDNEFDETGLGEGWAWDYESNWFAAPTSAISFNDNCVDVIVTLEKGGYVPKVRIFPETKYIVTINKVNASSKDSTFIDVYRERGTNVVTIFGTIKPGDSVKTFVTVNNPTQYSMVILKEILEKKGIKVGGFPMDIDDISAPVNYSNFIKLFTFYSPELKDVMKVINKSSMNFYAEQLLKTIGLEIIGFGSSENGIEASKEVLEEMGINTENIIIVDGSGLSRLNLITTHQLVGILSYMIKTEYYIPFYNSLSIAGIDGTMGDRLKNTLAENNVRAKTGFLNSARSIAGYVNTLDGELIAFSIIINNFNVPTKLVDNIQDLVCLRLANFKRN